MQRKLAQTGYLSVELVGTSRLHLASGLAIELPKKALKTQYGGLLNHQSFPGLENVSWRTCSICVALGVEEINQPWRV